MKLKNKKTGEIGTPRIAYQEIYIDAENKTYCYKSLQGVFEEWEDCEEPKSWWYIDIHGPHNVIKNDEYYQVVKEASKEIGNYFETKEEAEKSIEKLKAWKRLKDKGFRFTLTPATGSLDATPDKFQIEINAEMPAKYFCCDAVQEDLDACFGGEE